MLTWSRVLACAAVLLAGCETAPRRSVAAIEAVVAEEQVRQGVPGVAVAVLRQGRVILARGWGLANVEHDVPVTPATVFQAGSLAKQFAGVATMLLVEDGLLALDDPIIRFLPEAPPAWQPITVRQLLTHTAGIPNFPDGALDHRRDHTEEELARLAFGLPLAFPPGSDWLYSDTGYVLLGLVLRRASGRFYGDILRERVFAPLGMASARVISEEDIVRHRAAGYRRVDGVLKNQQWVAPSLNTTADGSLYLSLDDWMRWAQALRQRAVLRPDSWAEVFAPVRLAHGRMHPYGLGWELPEGPARYQHVGAWQGFQAAYQHVVDEDLTVIVLCNLAEADPMRLAERARQAVQPTPSPDLD